MEIEKKSNHMAVAAIVISSLVLALISGTIAVSGSGCRTVSNTNQVDISTIAAAIKGVAHSATLYAVRKDPKSASYLRAVANGLGTFASQTNHDPASLQAFLDGLPIKQLQTPEAQLAVSIITTAYEVYWIRYPAPVDLRNKEFVKYLEALAAGINLGMSPQPLIP